MEDFEKAKSEIIKGFQELYEGKSTGFPDWAFFESIFYLADKNKENYLFAKRIYHVLDDLFSSVKDFYHEYLKIDKQNKTVTIKRFTSYCNKVQVDSIIEITDYKDKLPQFALYENETLEFLNENAKSYSELKYMGFIKEDLQPVDYYNIKQIKRLYKNDTLTIALDKSIHSMTFEKFIDIYYSKEKITTKSQKSQVVKKIINDKKFGTMKGKVDFFDAKYYFHRDKNKALYEFENTQKTGYSRKTLERCIKAIYGDNLTFESYVKTYLVDNLTDKKKSISI